MDSDTPPQLVSAEAQQAFEAQAKALGMDPQAPWVGGYVDYEWRHLRHILAAYGINAEGIEVLEFGCNVGASAILFAHLGAHVTALDIDPALVELARLNAGRYGIDGIEFITVPDTRTLPFGDRCFDLVNCNSVLEYVATAERTAVQQEINRVTRPGGRILVTGTSNRPWPREVHSGKWLVNYLPASLDSLLGHSLERGIPPWTVRYGFGSHYRNLDATDTGRAFRQSRLKMGTSSLQLDLLIRLVRLIGTGPGMLANNISCLLQKQTEK